MYSKIVKLKQEKPTALRSFLELFSNLNDSEVKNMYVLPRMCTDDMILKELQYKVLHKYLPTNDLLYKMKKISTKKCTFCNMYRENTIHIFYECTHVKQVLFKVQEIICKLDNQPSVFTIKDVILGFRMHDLSVSNLKINNLILHYKMYIWKCKILFVQPSYNKLKEYIGSRQLYESRVSDYYDEM